MKSKFVHTYNYICDLHPQFKNRIMEPTTKELINKTQLSPKTIPMSSRRLGGSTKESHFTYSTAVILLPRTMVRDHHRYQPYGTKIARGEFIIKEINTKIK